MMKTYFTTADHEYLLALDLPCENQGAPALDLWEPRRHVWHIVIFARNAIERQIHGAEDRSVSD
jgi:hypothetical protein